MGPGNARPTRLKMCLTPAAEVSGDPGFSRPVHTMSATMSPLPNLFVIGAPKCGTTTLHAYLGRHSAISMSEPKEPEVFASEVADPSARYSGMLAPGAAVRGESSTVYSQSPRWPGVPERIARHCPDARFLYLVRDPIERAESHYQQHVAHGKETRPAHEALADRRDPDSLFVCPSRYATQLRRYLDNFERDRVLVLDSARLAGQPEVLLGEVFDFLGLDREPIGPALRLNTREAVAGSVSWVPDGLPARLARVSAPAPLRRIGRRLLTRKVEPVVFDEGLRRELRSILEPEVSWLRDLSGQQFPSWSV